MIFVEYAGSLKLLGELRALGWLAERSTFDSRDQIAHLNGGPVFYCRKVGVTKTYLAPSL